MKHLLSILTVALLSGCTQIPPISVNQTTNPNMQVAFLFEHDGCKVYRFEDQSRTHYYTDCRGSTITGQSCGKNCDYSETIQTARKKHGRK